MRRFIGYFVLPVWLAGGFLDYVWHRRTRIETTTGLSESLMHTLMMVEAGPAVFGALFLEVNAGVIAMIVSAAVVHEATAIWDVFYTSPRRTILPAEQHIHSFLEMVPFCVASAAVCIHWNQARALVGRGPEQPDFEIRLRRPAIWLAIHVDDYEWVHASGRITPRGRTVALLAGATEGPGGP